MVAPEASPARTGPENIDEIRGFLENTFSVGESQVRRLAGESTAADLSVRTVSIFSPCLRIKEHKKGALGVEAFRSKAWKAMLTNSQSLRSFVSSAVSANASAKRRWQG